MIEVCPSCGGTHVVKKGKRCGRQRYLCMSCSACFTEGIKYEEGKKRLPAKVKCPFCGGKANRRGKLGDGTQRYECIECHTSFSRKTRSTHKKTSRGKDLPCPYCGGHLTYTGTNTSGRQRFLCTKCGRACSGDENGTPRALIRFGEINTSVKCPECSSTNIKRSGHNKFSVQRYRCNSCGRMFIEEPQAIVHSKEKEQEAVREVLNGVSVKKVAVKYKYSLERLKKIMQKWYKTETITKQQKKDIIKYGYFLKVPIDYMAEYVKCSEKKCREVLTAYKKKAKSTNHDAI